MFEEIEAQISAIKFALGSLARYTNEEERKQYLELNFERILHLDTYYIFSLEMLISALEVNQQQRTGVRITYFHVSNTYLCLISFF